MNQKENLNDKKKKIDSVLDKLSPSNKINLGAGLLIVSLFLMFNSGFMYFLGIFLFFLSAYVVFRGTRQTDDPKMKKRGYLTLALFVTAIGISYSYSSGMSKEDAREEIAELEKNKSPISPKMIGHWVRGEESVEITNQEIIHRKIQFSALKETKESLHGVDCSSDTQCKGNTGARFWKRENKILTNGYFELKASGDDLTITFSPGDKSEPDASAAGNWKRSDNPPNLEAKARKKKEDKRAEQEQERLALRQKTFTKLAGEWILDGAKSLKAQQLKNNREAETALEENLVSENEFADLHRRYAWTFLTNKKDCHKKAAFPPTHAGGLPIKDRFEAEELRKNAPSLRKEIEGKLVRFEFNWSPDTIEQTKKYCYDSKGSEEWSPSICIHPYNFKRKSFRLDINAGEFYRWPLSLKSVSPSIKKRKGKLAKKYQDFVNASSLSVQLKLPGDEAKALLADPDLTVSIIYQFKGYGYHKSCEKVCGVLGKCEIKNLGLGYDKYGGSDHSYVKGKIVDLSIKQSGEEIYGYHQLKQQKPKKASLSSMNGLFTKLTLEPAQIEGKALNASTAFSYQGNKGKQALTAKATKIEERSFQIKQADWEKPAILTVSNGQLTVEHQGVKSYLKRASK